MEKTPASASYLDTPAQKLMSQYLAEKVPIGSRTQADFEMAQLKKQIVTALRNNMALSPELAKKFGRLAAGEQTRLINESQNPGLVNGFHRLGLEEAMNVYEVASADEKRMLRGPLVDKLMNAFDKGALEPDKAAELFKRLNSINIASNKNSRIIN